MLTQGALDFGNQTIPNANWIHTDAYNPMYNKTGN